MLGRTLRRRKIMALWSVILLGMAIWASHLALPVEVETQTNEIDEKIFVEKTALDELSGLEVKGRASKTGYRRSKFSDGWGRVEGCSVREIILARDLTDRRIDNRCRVQSGTLKDPYTNKTIQFKRGPESSKLVQIDHVVALSDAWQKGAQQLPDETRYQLANDPLNLLAVDGEANQAKGDSDAATWLPPNKAFRCQYAKRQVAVKKKYSLWVTAAEKQVLAEILEKCTNI